MTDAPPSLLRIAAETWRALARPRRSVPVAAVAGPLLLAQGWWSFEPLSAVLAGLLLCAGAVGLAPVAWRWCVARWPGTAGAAAYVALGALCGVLLALPVPRLLGFEDPFLTQPATLPFVVGMMLASGWGLGRDVSAEEALLAAAERQEALRRERDHAELLAIRAHLDPHFLFNTLNAIAEWCATDPAVAEAAILRLASVLRTILGAIEAPSWSLARELALATDVLELYRSRDPQRFAFAVQAPDERELERWSVPAMLLLPLVENAIRHGPAAGHPGAVEVRIVAGDALRIEVRNPGPYSGPRAGGRGLELVRRRLALDAGPAARFEIASTDGITTAVVVVPSAAG